MRVMVSGGMGFIGSHIVDYCQEKKWDVDVWDLKNGKDIRFFDANKDGKFDIIFHLAAQAKIAKTEGSPIMSHQHNIIGTLRILEYAKKFKSKVIFSSSSSVYKIDSHYAIQKKQCEEYIEFYRRYGVKSCILRYFNVFGERQEIAQGGYSLVLPKFLRQHGEGKPFTIYGTGEQRRDFTYVGDVVRASVMAIKKEGIFDVGRGENTSINELANMIGSAHPKEYLPSKDEVFKKKAKKSMWIPQWSPTINISQWINKFKTIQII